jgi:uncharacterized SAM-binding protein YcdF (DUF218 family)
MFIVSKVIGVLTQPANLMLLALVMGIALLFSRWARLGRAMLAALAAMLVLVAVLPWEDYLIAPLERRFPPPQAMPAQVDGIVVLGGAIDPESSAAWGEPSLNGAAERVTALMQLVRRYPAARLVYTGGSGSVTAQEFKEAPVAKALFDSLGMETGRVVFEAQSRNTWENATLTKELVNPLPGESWLLVTSAAHMPRSVGAFRAAGWKVTAYPVDYASSGRGAGLRFSLGGGLGALGGATHEWLGLAYYRWRGWSDSWYPSP